MDNTIDEEIAGAYFHSACRIAVMRIDHAAGQLQRATLAMTEVALAMRGSGSRLAVRPGAYSEHAARRSGR